MNKRIKLLASGALAALALMALPALASAGEYKADCQTGAQCSANVSGGTATLYNTKNEGIHCTGVEGTANQTSESPTGNVQLNFTGCREQATIFKFTCSNTGTAGRIATNTMISHIVNLSDTKVTPGVLLTGVNVTFACAGFAKKTVTGSILGHMHDPNCGEFRASHSIAFEEGALGKGHQKYTQVTETGQEHDLVSNNHDGGEYTTSSQTGTGTLTYKEGNKVKITC